MLASTNLRVGIDELDASTTNTFRRTGQLLISSPANPRQFFIFKLPRGMAT